MRKIFVLTALAVLALGACKKKDITPDNQGKDKVGTLPSRNKDTSGIRFYYILIGRSQNRLIAFKPFYLF